MCLYYIEKRELNSIVYKIGIVRLEYKWYREVMHIPLIKYM